jgi:hypothetical protein
MKKNKGYLLAAMLLIVFMGSCKKDDDPTGLPLVSSTDPKNNALDIAINSSVSATFNVSMDPSTINDANFTLKQGTTAVAGVTEFTEKTASFIPTENLAADKVYTATITTGAKDMNGKSLAKEYVWSFTSGATVDLTVPKITLTSPLNNATGVARNKPFVITFNKPMNASTINTSTVTMKKGTTNVTGVVTYTGTTATFTPSALLEVKAIYTATVTTGAKDMDGNAITANKVVTFTTGGSAATLAVVDLGSAGNYVILAKASINNNSTSAITGDLGLSPAATSYATGLALTDATGYATSSQVTGKVYAADMADPTPINLTTSVNNMLTAYTDAAGRPSPDFSELGTGNIGGKTLTPGLYKWTSTVTLPTDVTISGGANDVWIFQISGDLTMSSAVNMTLIGGAQAKNIFWQVAGQVTLGTTSHFEGIVLSKTGITLQTGGSFKGRLLAQTTVILDSNTVTKP